jgi:threonine/homoserine/homoserine lactone efflux protein
VWKALVFGAVVAGAIGPIALLIFGTAARRGFGAGAMAGLGAASADFVYAFAAFLAGAFLLPLLAAHERAIRTGCALLLIGLGSSILARLRSARTTPPAPASAARSYLGAFLLTIVNPMTLGVFAGIATQLPLAGSAATAAALALSLAAGSAAVQLAIAASGAALGSAIPGAGWQRWISIAAASGILGFGIAGLVGA